MARKLCVYWQGRQSHSTGVRKHGVFERCYGSLAQAQSAARAIAKKRGSSSLVEESSGLTKTLMTCRKTRCKVTIFGQKHGMAGAPAWWPFKKAKKPAKRHPMSRTVYMMKTKSGSYIPVDRPPNASMAGSRKRNKTKARRR
jgi:hypothetical protein